MRHSRDGESILSEGVWNLSDLEEKAFKPSQWIATSSNAYRAAGSGHEKMPAGIYDITRDMQSGDTIFIRKTIKTDDLVNIPGGLIESTLAEIEAFWASPKKYKDNGVLHRRGYILYGAQGTGKSSALNMIMGGIVKKDGVVFVCTNPKFLVSALDIFRKVEPTRHLVCIFEDVDTLIKTHGEYEILAILDGNDQVDHVLNIATTNYPELLDKRLISRPRRFDRAIKIMAPNADERRHYFEAKIPKTLFTKDADLEDFVEKTEGLSFAALTEVIIAVQCLDQTLDEIVVILKDLETRNYKNEEDVPTGFNAATADADE